MTPRMKTLIGIVSGVLLISAMPALADHVTEPTAPVTDAQWRVYPYPQGRLQACGPLVDEGQEPYVFSPQDNVRFELDVFTEAGQDPSEHWFTRVVFSELVPGRRDQLREVKQWDLSWPHQNKAAHKLSPEHQQNNLYNLDPGAYRLTAVLIGDASGNRITATCDFFVE